MKIKKDDIEKIILNALNEDLGSGDITTALITPKNSKATAVFLAKENGIIAGLDFAKTVFKMLDWKIVFKKFISDGDHVKAKTKIAEASGNLRALLSGERTALNILQRCSGIATSTKEYVGLVKDTNVKILDTRKTVPGLRVLDKYSVRAGGGTNHRIGLYDMVLIKDNHIKVAGSTTKAVAIAKAGLKRKIKIEVETKNLTEVKEALDAKVDIIMLDNMPLKTMRKAVELVGGKVKLEASGNVNLKTVSAIAKTGVDYISVGALTHSVKALDISMKII